MIAEAVDTLWAMGWALFAWIAAAATVVTLLLLGTVAAIWQASAWLCARVAASNPSRADGEPHAFENASQARTAARTPAWAHTQPHDTEDAA